MNILILHAGAELYGADKVLLELLKNINKEKFTPYVILPCNGPLVDEFEKNNINVKVMEYPVLRRKYFNIKGIVQYIYNYFKYSREIIKYAKEKKIDVIHTNTAAVLEGIMVKKVLKIPQIWHIHEIIVKPKFLNKFLSFLIARNSDQVITVSNAVKNHLNRTKYFTKEIEVIYNGVDNNVFNNKNEIEYLREQFKIQPKEIVVGMIGRINAWKGQNDFLQAIDKVMDKHDNVKALVVGGVFEGEEWRIDELKTTIKYMKHGNRVVLEDYRKDTQNIHNVFDIFVLPSTNPDPLPTVVLESMATAKPIVGYRHGGICEMVKENYNGLLAEVRNIDDLANKIESLISNDVMRGEFSQNSLQRQINHFSLINYIDNFEKLYETINK